ncbi:hypothetical protein, partial [Parvularcula oceani]|uniref:hypothetical protein n=1 Tax=Parvularcula oceani TaxID=1247963 RepID=UPI0004E193E0
LITQAQWAWHSFPNPEGFTLDDAMRPIDARGEAYEYPYVSDWSQVEADPALQWLRRNPHRYSLGRLSFRLADGEGGRALAAEDISATEQRLDLWTGTAHSRFTLEGEPVAVRTQVHPDEDLVLVEITSPLVEERRLGLDLSFPYVSDALNPDPADWSSPDRHRTELRETDDRDTVRIDRRLDEARYSVAASFGGAEAPRLSDRHVVTAMPSGQGDTLRAMIAFAPDEAALPDAQAQAAIAREAEEGWQAFWKRGGMIDFSGSTDPRAEELERRVVLSQYLTRVNGGTRLILQEEGLYSNSWNGKFHHEMHWWHAAHFTLWGRDELTAPALDWYADTLPQARARAAHYRREGAWWPKMTGPDAVESPSTINPFIMWQQPHPIYLAELLYRAAPSEETLRQHSEVVFATADLLASFLSGTGDGDLALGPPVVPVQEVWAPGATADPAFELAYWAYGLRTAQRWRERLGLAPDEGWAEALDRLPELPQEDGLYLPVRNAEGFWSGINRPECAGGLGTTGGAEAEGGAPAEDCFNRDHPSFLMAMGFLPGDDADREVMAATMARTNQAWDFRQTWGWDFPMMAMTAARLGEPGQAVDYLMMDAANNQYGITGMTPRFHLTPEGYERNADTYFPSNASLLAAVALMAAGWDGAEGEAPGFPQDGWSVRAEGLRPLP